MIMMMPMGDDDDNDDDDDDDDDDDNNDDGDGKNSGDDKIKKCEPRAIRGHCNAIFIRSYILTFSFALFIHRVISAC